MKHITGTRKEWLAARLELLEAEKELIRRSDELARRRELPWVRIDKEYRFETDEGSASLADLFRGRSQLLVYHFMFGPDYTAGCPHCSAIADGFDGFVVHLANHDVTLSAVSRAPLAKLQAFKRRMGWTFPWASSLGSDFNFDFNVSVTEEQQRDGAVEYNYERGGHALDAKPEAAAEGPVALAATTGTDVATYTRERPGMSAFALEDGVVYHAYSTYARGLDGLWGLYQWLDRAPRGRNETGVWMRRHDEYDRAERSRGCRSSLPEFLRWDAERPVEARGRVLPRDDHRHLRDGVVVVVPLHAREELVVDVAVRVRDRVGVFERHPLRVAEERALRVVVERLEFLRRDAEPAAHGSIGVLSELAAVPPGDATVEQRPERTGHALRALLEGGPHPLRGAEERRVARVKEVRIERRAPELALFLEHFAQVVRERLDVDRRDARFPL